MHATTGKATRAICCCPDPDNAAPPAWSLEIINRFLGCRSPDCALCRHNPHKRCGGRDSFDECYADNQVGIPGTQLSITSGRNMQLPTRWLRLRCSLQAVVSVGCYQVLGSSSYIAEL